MAVAFRCWWADFRSKTTMPENWSVDERDTEFHAAVMDWMRSLGLDPNRLLPALGVCPWQGKFELHVDEMVADTRPDRRADSRCDPLLAEASIMTQRRIIHVELDSWPARPPLEERVA
jgi:hypothetical protein